ncbi:hypothetical protein HPB47_003581 [Ixodes persulcatus]|uniref:Uncharacterized protein n=1 Tax=Ixodes persulcatus TaxID=34615 RepID=A0AC60PI68_IXOPE|nr:hypothetical protein HPB47_003581 [Ixodes persulcatus]
MDPSCTARSVVPDEYNSTVLGTLSRRLLRDLEPLPPHMPPEQVERRRTFVKKHVKWTQTACLEEDMRIVYTDTACPQDVTDAMPQRNPSTARKQKGTLSLIMFNMQTIPPTTATPRPISTSLQILKLHIGLVRILGTPPLLLSSSDSPCNAYVLSGTTSQYTKYPDTPEYLATKKLTASQTRSYYPCRPEQDPKIQSAFLTNKFKARHYRRAYLLAAANLLLTPFPPSQLFSRRQLFTLRQIQTGTILTPYLLQRFRQHSCSHREKGRCAATTNLPGTCALCHANADLEHLLCDCLLYSEPRIRTLATIQQSFRSTSLHAWACPDPSFPKVTTIELGRSLLAYIQDPAAPPDETEYRLCSPSRAAFAVARIVDEI